MTAYRAVVVQGGVQSGQGVLVTGVGGGVATFALQFAVAAEARVWVTPASPRKIQHAVSLGARGGFDYRRAGWHRELLEQSGPMDLVNRHHIHPVVDQVFSLDDAPAAVAHMADWPQFGKLVLNCRI